MSPGVRFRPIYLLAATLLFFAPLLVSAGHAAGAAAVANIDAWRSASERTIEPDSDRLIDFDDWPAPRYFHHAIAARYEYWWWGVAFNGPGPIDGGAILNELSSFQVNGYSPPNFLAFNCNEQLSNGGVPRCPAEIIFLHPTGSVSALVGCGHSAGQTLTMEAFDGNGESLDRDTVVLSETMTEISVVAPTAQTCIAKVVLSGVECWVLDNLEFSARVVADEENSWSEVKNLYR